MLIKNAFKEVKALDKGEGIVVIATLNVVDKDGDVTLAGAFGHQDVPIVPAHDWSAAPIGKAHVHEEGDEVLADLKLNLKTDLGANWYEALKFDLDNPPAKQEYSYGFSIRSGGADRGDFAGKPVRFLTDMEVHEVSPVLLGAGIATRTLTLKQRDKSTVLGEQLAQLKSDARDLVARLKEIEAMRAKEGRHISSARLDECGEIKKLIEELDEIIRRPRLSAEARDLAAKNFELRMRMLDDKIRRNQE